MPAAGEARDDWAIAVGFGRRLEALLRPAEPTLFPYDGPEAIWNEHRASTRGRDLDITGLDWARLEERPAQWPWPAGAAAGKLRTLSVIWDLTPRPCWSHYSGDRFRLSNGTSPRRS